MADTLNALPSSNKLTPQGTDAVLSMAQADTDKGAIVHTFDPDASPQQKAASAAKAVNQLKTSVNAGGKELSVDVGHASVTPTITISDADKQFDDEKRPLNGPPRSPALSSPAPLSPTESLPGALQETPPHVIPNWYRIGWRAVAGIDNPPLTETEAIQDALSTFLKEQYYGEWYHNAGVIFFAVIASHFITLFRLGWGALLILLAFCATYYSISIARVRHQARDDIQRELVKTRLLSEHETADWINNFMDRFWKIYEPVLSNTIISSVDQILSVNTPPFLESLRLTTFTLGNKAPRIDSVRTFPNTEDDVVMMDWDFSFTPIDISDTPPRLLKTKVNPKIILSVRLGKGFATAALPILVEDITFAGKMRIRMKLMNNPPHIQIIDLTFLEKPKIDYVLKPVGGETFGFDIASIPGLSTFIRDMTHGTLEPMMYDPNVFTLNLEQLLSGAPLDAAIGVLQVTIHTASSLNISRLGGGAPDPYVSLNINQREELSRTKWQSSTYNPAWHETKFLLVNSLTESLYLQLYDYNEHRKDTPIGFAAFELAKLHEDAIQEDIALPVMKDGKNRGELRFDISFYPVLTPTKVDGVEEPLPETSTGIVRLTIHQAKELDASKSLSKDLNPFARVYTTSSKKPIYETKRPKHTLTPVWESATEFLCADRPSSVITVKIIDDRDFLSDPVVGYLRVKLQDLLKAKTEVGKDWWPLSGCKSGRIRLTAEWKPLNIAGGLQGADQYTPAIGIIRLWLKKATDVKNVEAAFGGKSDPYVRVMLQNIVKARTEVINNNLNPEWDQIVYVPVHSPREVLLLECMDYQNLTKDRSLGSVELRLNNLVQESPENKEYPYASTGKQEYTEPIRLDRNNTNKGHLHFMAEFVPALRLKDIKFDAPSNELEQAAENAVKTDSNTSSSNVSEEHLASPSGVKGQNGMEDNFVPGHTRGEKSTDTMMTANTSNSIDKEPAFEGVTLTKEELLKHQSGVIVFNIIGGNFAKKSRLEVVLDDSSWPVVVTPKGRSVHAKINMISEGFVKEMDFGQIWFKLDESENDDKDVIYAELKVDTKVFLEKCLDGPSTFTLTDQDGGNVSTLEIAAKYIPVDIVLEPRESINNQGVLQIELLSAHDILAADRGGKSDPFAVFTLNGQKIFRSETKKKTLSPEWNEHFEVSVPSRVGSLFEVELLDWNQIEQAKSLGAGTVDIEALEPFEQKTVNIPLSTAKRGVKGEVQIRLVFKPSIIVKTRKNTSTFSSAGRAMTQVGGIPLGAGRGLVQGVGFAGKTMKGIFARGDKDDEPKASLDVPDASTARILPDIPTTGPVDYTQAAVTMTATAVPPAIATQEDQGGVHEYGMLKVTVLAAKDLAVAPGDSVKPYVSVKVGEKELKTKHAGKTTTPEWDETLKFPAGPETTSIIAAVWDHKTIGKDRILGETDIDIWKHISPAAPSQDLWVELRDGQGLLRVRLEYERNRRNSVASTIGGGKFSSLRRASTRPDRS